MNIRSKERSEFIRGGERNANIFGRSLLEKLQLNWKELRKVMKVETVDPENERAIHFALKPKVEEELDKLEGMGIIFEVNTSEWATLVVPVVKKNGKVRLCGDFKVTLNQQLMVDQYPLPRIEDILASLAKGEKFTTLDLCQAYLHMEMSDKTQRIISSIDWYLG